MALRIEAFDVEVTVRRAPRRPADGRVSATAGMLPVQSGGPVTTAPGSNGHGPTPIPPRGGSPVADRVLSRAAAGATLKPAGGSPTLAMTSPAPRMAPPISAPTPKPLGLPVAQPGRPKTATGFKPMFKRLAPPPREAVSESALGARLDDAGSGRRLGEATRRQMAELFDADLGDVRIHADEQAARLASDLGAEALTVGRDIYFADGKFDPASDDGRGLLAHELTHVLQQKAVPRPRAQNFTDGLGADPLESEAEAVRQAVLGGPAQLRSERLTVEKYRCTYQPNREMSATELARVEKIAARALQVCEEILSARTDTATLTPAPIETLTLDVAVALVATSDEAAARAWGRTMAEAIIKAAKASADAGAGVQKRDEGADPKTEEKKLSEREKIDVALKSWDADDVDEVEDFTTANESERMTLAHIVVEHHGIIFGLDDRRSLRRIWSSFPDPIDVASRNMTDWESSVETYGALRELDWVVKTQNDFKNDIATIAIKNLDENKTYLEAERDKLKNLTEEKRKAYVEAVQKIGREILKLRDEQRRMTDVIIGYKYVHGFLSNVADLRFVPGKPPDPSKDEHDNEEDKGPTHREMQTQHDQAAEKITKGAADYPWILGLLKDKESEARLKNLAEIKDPNAALSEMREELERLADRAHGAQLRVRIGKVDWFDLHPIRNLLLAGGKAPSGLQWGAPQKGESFRNWAAEDAVRGREEKDYWTQFALEKGVEAALIIASLASGGIAPLLVGVVAAGVSGVQAAVHYANAQELTDLSKATVLPGTDLVTRAQIDAEETAAVAAAITAFVTAAMSAVEFIKFRRLMAFRPTGEVAKSVLGYATSRSAAETRFAQAVKELGPNVEVGLYQHAKSGEYAIVKGNEAQVGRGLGDLWIPKIHTHPNIGSAALRPATRLGSAADLKKLMRQAQALDQDLTAAVLHTDENGVQRLFHYSVKKVGGKWQYTIRYELSPGKVVEDVFEEAALELRMKQHVEQVLRAAAQGQAGVPLLNPGKGFEMFKEAMKHLSDAPPAKRVSLAREFEKQILQNQRPRGSFEFIEQQCTNGTLFKGKANEALVFDAEGKMFRGKVTDAAQFQFLGPGAHPMQGRYEAIYKNLRPL